MASLVDIPVQYLLPDQKGNFIIWLTQQPVPVNVRRQLIFKWIRVTRTPFYVDDYAMAAASVSKGLGAR